VGRWTELSFQEIAAMRFPPPTHLERVPDRAPIKPKLRGVLAAWIKERRSGPALAARRCT
jgi:hypothetical protein